MKIIILLLLLSTTVSAQNVVSVTYQPIDNGFGLRYDRIFNDFGLYTSLSKGNYKTLDLFIKDHYKVCLGSTMTIEKCFLSLGLSYNHYGEHSEPINHVIITPVSYEVGAGAILNRLMVAFRIDPVKWESNIDIGLRF
jgi:hypothetical protein